MSQLSQPPFFACDSCDGWQDYINLALLRSAIGMMEWWNDGMLEYWNKRLSCISCQGESSAKTRCTKRIHRGKIIIRLAPLFIRKSYTQNRESVSTIKNITWHTNFPSFRRRCLKHARRALFFPASQLHNFPASLFSPQAFKICPKGTIPSFQYSNIPSFQLWAQRTQALLLFFGPLQDLIKFGPPSVVLGYRGVNSW